MARATPQLRTKDGPRNIIAIRKALLFNSQKDAQNELPCATIMSPQGEGMNINVRGSTSLETA